jgi:hypothetical protein
MGLGKPRATLEEAPTRNEEDLSSESDEEEVVLTPKKRKAVFRPFQAGPSRAEALAAPESGVSKLEEEVEHLRAENTKMKADVERVEGLQKELARLQGENEKLCASNSRYRIFCLDTRQQARAQHAELLSISNRFYNHSMEWSNAEKDMTQFLALEERALEEPAQE